MRGKQRMRGETKIDPSQGATMNMILIIKSKVVYNFQLTRAKVFVGRVDGDPFPMTTFQRHQ